MYSTATHSEPGTVCMQLHQKEPKESCFYTATAPLFALNGREPGAVPVPSTMPSIFALDAVKHLMELNSALIHRKLRAVTPYHPETWDSSLREAGIYDKYL